MSRLGIVGMWHETNTYSTHVATLEDFEAFELLEGTAIIDHHAGTESVVGGFVAESSHDLVPIYTAGAWPSGPASGDTAHYLLGRLEALLADAGDLDGVFVNLHGAMVTEHDSDFEATTVGTVRRHVGNVPIVCVLDFHANPSSRLVDLADVVIAYDTYPHVDMLERGCEAATLMDRLLSGEALRTRIGKYPLLVAPLAQGTDDAPMDGVFAAARRLAVEESIERVSIAGGFAYSDVERAGISVLATAGPDADDRCRRLFEGVFTYLDEIADDFTVTRPGPKEAVATALRSEQPVVLADVADNIGGGSAGDGTAILAELIAQQARNALVVIADAEIAQLAHRLGVGATIRGMLGGKTDDLHGSPVEISGEVVGLSDGRYVSGGSWTAGLEVSQGRTAWLSVDGVDVVVTQFPRPPFHVEQVTHIGIDPTRASIIVAKGAVAWKAAYGDVAATIIEVDAPGVCPVDLTRLPRSTTPVRVP